MSMTLPFNGNASLPDPDDNADRERGSRLSVLTTIATRNLQLITSPSL